MRAVVVERWMEPRELAVSEVPEPELRPGALKLEVRAAGCNFFDILMLQGRYQVKPVFPFVPGAEVAGVVREVGAGVRGFAPGDRVFATAGSAASPRSPWHRRAPRTTSPTDRMQIRLLRAASFVARCGGDRRKAGEREIGGELGAHPRS